MGNVNFCAIRTNFEAAVSDVLSPSIASATVHTQRSQPTAILRDLGLRRIVMPFAPLTLRTCSAATGDAPDAADAQGMRDGSVADAMFARCVQLRRPSEK